MALLFREAHAAPDKKQINQEYFILENAGATSINTGGLQVIAAKKGKKHIKDSCFALNDLDIDYWQESNDKKTVLNSAAKLQHKYC